VDLNKSNRAMLVPPGELAGPAPRKVAFCSTSGTYIVMLIAFLAAIFGVWVAVSLVRHTQHRALLRKNSREVVGRVTDTVAGRDGKTYVEYSFTVEGVTYFGNTQEPSSRGPWDALTRSHPILIRYLSSNPAINHPAAWEWSVRMNLDGYIFTIFFTTMGGIGVAYLMRERKLASEGRAAAGLVTSCTPQRRWFQVEYEFHTEEGESLTGKCDSADSYEVGARIWVIYLSASEAKAKSPLSPR
jgi:hypothetical protein